MAGLSDFEKLLPELSPGERAQILKWVVQQLGGSFAGIDSWPEVCNGEPCIVRTRIPVWILEQARRLGASEQALLTAYPTPRAGGLRKRLSLCPFSRRGNQRPDYRERGRLSGPFLFQRKHRAAGSSGTQAG